MNFFLNNSKSQLIDNKYNQKSLKEKHFSKFLNNIANNPYYNYMSNNYRENTKKYMINDKYVGQMDNYYEINITNKDIIENKSQDYFKKHKFKNPKLLNYNNRIKPPQFRNFNKEVNKDNNQNIIFNYKTYLKENYLENKMNSNILNQYNPKKISNNYINLYQNNNNSKISPIKTFQKSKIDINDEKQRYKKNKINFKYDIREGYFGRKEKEGIPLLFDTSTTFYNKYSNKSEKKRHENILDDLYKLKAFLISNKKMQISIFKDFLIKYKIKNIEQFSDEKILSICNYICNNNKEFLINLIKPYLTVKELLVDLFNNISSINNINEGDLNKNSNKEKSNKNKAILLKQKSEPQLFDNLNDDLLFKTKIENKNNKINYEKNNIKDNINITNNLTDMENSKDIFLKTENSYFNRNIINIYQSPFFIPHKSHIILSQKNETKINESPIKKYTDLFETNSLLKNLSYQTKALGPTKEYSINNDLIINDISKEMKDLENDYNSVILTGKIFNKNKTQNNFYIKRNSNNNEFNILKNTGFSHSPSNLNKDLELKTKDFFSNTSIHLQLKNRIINNKDKINKINLNIISLKNKNFEKLRKYVNNSQPNKKKRIKKNAISLNEYNIRMYYRPIKYRFGYQQIKDLNKVTECAALNYAKKKKYDPLGLECNL